MRKSIIAFAALAALFASAIPARAQDVGLPIGSVPETAELEDLDGNPIDLGTVIGGKPAIIEFWATWCPLCEALEPRMHDVSRQFADSLQVVIVAVGVNQSPRTIRRHIADHPQPGVLLFDRRGRATRAFMAPATSYVVALDAAGRVVYTGIGADQDIAAAARRALAQ